MPVERDFTRLRVQSDSKGKKEKRNDYDKQPSYAGVTSGAWHPGAATRAAKVIFGCNILIHPMQKADASIKNVLSVKALRLQRQNAAQLHPLLLCVQAQQLQFLQSLHLLREHLHLRVRE